MRVQFFLKDIDDIVHLCLPGEGPRPGLWHSQIPIPNAPAHFFFDAPARAPVYPPAPWQGGVSGTIVDQAAIVPGMGGPEGQKEDRGLRQGRHPLDETVGNLSYLLAGCRWERLIAKKMVQHCDC